MKKTKEHVDTAAAELLKSLNVIVGLDQLLENLCARLREMLNAGTVYVSLYEPITSRYKGTMARGASAEQLTLFSFPRSDSLVRWLNVNQCPLDIRRDTEVVRYLWPQGNGIMREHRLALVVPLIAVNHLTGILFLTEKGDGGTYTRSEVDALTMLAGQAALAIENAVMTQFQEARLQKLFHADKLATVGELAAGAAHEIRNPLTSIRSTVQFLKKDLPEGKHHHVDGIIEEVDRIDVIIKGLLSLSRSSDLHLSSVDVQDAIHQTMALLDPEMKKHGIVAAQAVRLSDPTIEADPAQLKQVFLNILLNSIQAMPTGGHITVNLSDSGAKTGQQESSNSIWIVITDSGPGIPSEWMEKVFDPFFTTKEDGTGLGLSISYGIINRHGGEIGIESRTDPPDRGTRVTIRLPRKASQRP